MIVNTDHGEFEVRDITRKERRKHYRKVKEVLQGGELGELHDLGDEFTLIAFGNEKEADKALEGLSAIEEDEVLNQIILDYFGFDLKNASGD
jgi:hypothetical protein